MAFQYVAAVNAFFGVNTLSLPEDTLTIFRDIGRATSVAERRLSEARVASRNGAVADAMRSAAGAVALAHHTAGPSVLAAVQVMERPPLAYAEYIRAAAANVFLASTAFKAAYKAQVVAMAMHRPTDDPVLTPRMNQSVRDMATRAQQAHQYYRATLDAAQCVERDLAMQHAVAAHSEARDAARVVQSEAAALLRHGPGSSSVTEHRAISELLLYAAVSLVAAANSFDLVGDMDSNLAEPNNGSATEVVADTNP